jgi:transposase InsO family protein
MSKTIKEERLRWIIPIYQGKITITQASAVCPYSKRSLERWLSVFRNGGENALEPKSTRPKTQPNETPIRLKEKVIEIRKDTKKCALKIKWQLQKEGMYIHERTIGKIIKSEGLVRKYRTKKIKYKYIKSQLQPGELIEIDVKYVPNKLDGKRYFQYTAIDCASRWRYLAIYDDQSSFNSIQFLKEVIKRFPYEIKAVKTDNHATFTNRYTGYIKSSNPMNPKLHSLDQFCISKGIMHYLIDPGKPQQNGKVERSHRSDQQSFYDECQFKSPDELKYRTRLWNMYYNDLEHCGLDGKTPNQILFLNPPKVRT